MRDAVTLAVTSDQKVFWEIALAVGAVVLVVVIALLTLLTTLVRDIDEGVSSLWTMAKRMAGNTATTHQIGAMSLLVQQLTEELLQHEELLRRR